jgi:hypothetical protein
MKDGIRNVRVRTPFKSPMPAPIASPASAASQMLVPALKIWAVTILVKMALAPTDRSNSPAIMSTPTPSAAIPTSGTCWNAVVTFAWLRYAKLPGAIAA